MVIDKLHGLRSTSVSLDARFTTAMAEKEDKERAAYLRNIAEQNLTLRLRREYEKFPPFQQTFMRRCRTERLVNYPAGLQRFRGQQWQAQRQYAGAPRGKDKSHQLHPRSASRLPNKQRQGLSEQEWDFENHKWGEGGSTYVQGGRGRGASFRGTTDGAVRSRGGAARRGALRGGQAAIRAGRGRAWDRSASANSADSADGSVQASASGVTAEQLDAQIEAYMSASKANLDRELDEYMRDPSDPE